jgi:hypothetical protein
MDTLLSFTTLVWNHRHSAPANPFTLREMLLGCIGPISRTWAAGRHRLPPARASGGSDMAGCDATEQRRSVHRRSRFRRRRRRRRPAGRPVPGGSGVAPSRTGTAPPRQRRFREESAAPIPRGISGAVARCATAPLGFALTAAPPQASRSSLEARLARARRRLGRARAPPPPGRRALLASGPRGGQPG